MKCKIMTFMEKTQEGRIFDMEPRSKTGGHDLRITGGTFKTSLRKYFAERVVYAWNRHPAEVASQSTVNGFKHAWDNQMYTQTKVTKKLNTKTYINKKKLDGPRLFSDVTFLCFCGQAWSGQNLEQSCMAISFYLSFSKLK